MQVTYAQVVKTLETLSRLDPPPSRTDGLLCLDALLAEAITRVNNLPSVRHERAEPARHPLSAYPMPSAEVLADKLIGRLVCDRLS